MTSWIPLVDYAARKGVSMSTLRRYIKAGKIEHRMEGGRYLVPAGSEADLEFASPDPDSKVRRLEQELKKAQEEIAELKMLVALYEDKMSFGRRDN